MDLSGILNRLTQPTLIAFIVALAFIAISFIFYRFYKKKGGRKRIPKRQFTLFALLLGWLSIVLILTTFTRGAHFTNSVNLHLFSGYVSAWHNWSLSEAQLLIFNIIMFIPLGFLLPFFLKKKSFLRLILITFSVTLGIEVFQLLTGRGIFELDDLFHNTLGSIIGYLFANAIREMIARKKVSFRMIAKGTFIPVSIFLFFLTVLVIYESRELGNLSIRPAISQDMNGVQIEKNVDLPDASDTVSLFNNDVVHNLDYAKEMLDILVDQFSFSETSGMHIEGFNRSWILADETNQEYTYNYFMNTGEWSLYANNFTEHTLIEEEIQPLQDFHEEWLRANELLPETAAFSVQNNATIRWDIEEDSTLMPKQDFEAGFLTLTPSPTSKQPLDLNYNFKKNTYVRELEVISPNQAFNEIKEGQFSIYNDLNQGDELVINDYDLTYQYDSKGFFQPIYQFTGTLNTTPWDIFIPAIK